MTLPSSLERIALSYYSYHDLKFAPEPLQEDLKLALLLKSKYLPNLTEVCVPLHCIDGFGKHQSLPPKDERVWKERRRALKREQVFVEGRVRLIERDGKLTIDSDAHLLAFHKFLSTFLLEYL